MALSEKELQELRELEELELLEKQYGSKEKRSAGQAITEDLGKTVSDVGSYLKEGAINRLEDIEALSAGHARNVLPGVAEETGGLIQTGLEAGASGLHNLFPSVFPESPTQVSSRMKQEGFTGDLGPQSLPEVYRKGTEEQEKYFEDLKKENPRAYGAGAITGTVSGGVGTYAGLAKVAKSLGVAPKALSEAYKLGGKSGVLKELAKIGAIEAPVGTIQGVADSEGNIIGAEGSDLDKVALDALGGTIMGAALGAAGGATSDLALPFAKRKLGEFGGWISKKSAQNSMSRPVVDAVEYGYKTGKTTMGKEAGEQSGKDLRETVEDIQKSLFEKEEIIEETLSKNLDEATKAGHVIKTTPNLESVFKEIETIGEQAPLQVGNLGILQNIVKDIKEGVLSNHMTPREAQSFRLRLKDMARSATDSQSQYYYNRLYKGLSDAIDQSVPDYAGINNILHNYWAKVTEPIMNQGRKFVKGERGLSMTETKNPYDKIYDELTSTIKTAFAGGIGAGDVRDKLNVIYKQMDEFDPILSDFLSKTKDPQKFTNFDKLSPNTNTLKQTIEAASRKRDMLTTAQTKNAATGVSGRSWAGETAKGGLTSLGSLVGKTARVVEKIPSAINKAPEAIFRKVSKVTKAEKIPNYFKKFAPETHQKYRNLFDGLEKAITDRDSFKKDAAIYTLLQYPDVREAIYGSEDLMYEDSE